ncbi:histone-lysine N-methyltransferase SETMAR-like protein [Leptotrombidium deliense]|uniref:Histone-lysine N-methyltransferase SETMAR-like protein n=1 Tax=Leptotrombidium deliense TaxID=299467 RepID=A0A443RXQ6_9ACAR|nr:histone-lysine N-methyltransferase SETMAR-like protein [Leptotrombidium deliense]
MSHTTAWRILRRMLCLFPYKVQLLQALTQTHIEARVRKIWFSYEAHFWMNGTSSSKITVIGLRKIHILMSARVAHPQRITVWCAISASGKVGPICTKENKTGARYKNMLQTQFLLFLKKNDYVSDSIFMQDGATPHRTRGRSSNWVIDNLELRLRHVIGAEGGHFENIVQ